MTPRPVNGWHWAEWVSELTGTGLLMFAVVSGWYWCVTAGSPWATPAVRIPILAIIAGGAVIAIAYSPLGARSGAHLNPAVLIGLWLQRSASTADLLGYVLAQLLGGTLGFALGRVWGPGVAAPATRWAQIAPDPALPQVVPALIETVVTAVQLVIVFLMLRRTHLAPWAGLAAGVLLGAAIATLAPITGAGFNPVRGIGPDLVARSFPAAWIYVVGPLAGAFIAAAGPRHPSSVKTAKLHHDPSVPCYLRCAIPHSPRQSDGSDAISPQGHYL